MGAHEGLLALLSGLQGVRLTGLSLLALGLLEYALQPLHPLMHPHIALEPSLPAPIGCCCVKTLFQPVCEQCKAKMSLKRNLCEPNSGELMSKAKGQKMCQMLASNAVIMRGCL